MANVHGKDAYVSLDDNDLSTYCNTVTSEEEADSHDVTTFGNDRKVYFGGLVDGTFSIGGFYDNSTTLGPRAVIKPLLGQVVEFVYRPEGTGSGKPEDTVNVLVTSYNESTPVADMITWTADLQMSGAMVSAAQGA